MSDWRIGLGFNVANGSLVDVETQFESNSVALGNAWVAQISPYNRFPNTVMTGFGKPYGFGRGIIVWEFSAIPNLAYEYLIETYFKSSGAWVASQKLTIKTRDTTPSDWIRLNVYPRFDSINGITDYNYYQQSFRLAFQVYGESG